MKMFFKVLFWIVLSLLTSFCAFKFVKYIIGEFFPQYISTDSNS